MRRSEHLSGEDLAAAATETATPRISRHLQRCEECRDRVADVAQVRATLHQAAEHIVTPPINIATLAVAQLHARHVTVGSFNELLSAIRTLIAALAAFMAPAPATPKEGEDTRE